MSTFKSLSDLTGRNALITGAVGGLGKVFADTLGELGANLILVDLPDKSIDGFAEELRKKWSVKRLCWPRYPSCHYRSSSLRESMGA